MRFWIIAAAIVFQAIIFLSWLVSFSLPKPEAWQAGVFLLIWIYLAAGGPWPFVVARPRPA